MKLAGEAVFCVSGVSMQVGCTRRTAHDAVAVLTISGGKKVARFQWPDDEARIRQRVLDDLVTGMRQLFAQLSSLDGGWVLLRFLDQNSNTLITLEDIAFRLGESNSTIEEA